MTSLLEIGEFQFENLVRNRIPFVLLNLGVDVGGLYLSFLQSQMESQMIMTTPENALKDFSAKHSSKDTAVVVICEDGGRSRPVAEKLVENGFHNVYFLAGGRKSLSPSKSL